RNGRFQLSAGGPGGESAHVEIGRGTHPPSWVPAYPSAAVQSRVTGIADDGSKSAEGGVFEFTSKDSPGQVMAFYEERCRALGMRVDLSTASRDGGKIIAEDDDGYRSLIVMIASEPGGSSSGRVTFKRRR